MVAKPVERGYYRSPPPPAVYREVITKALTAGPKSLADLALLVSDTYRGVAIAIRPYAEVDPATRNHRRQRWRLKESASE